MLSVKYSTLDFDRKMRNMINYSNGFLNGVQLGKTKFNAILAEYTIKALYKFIDAKARMNPESLHHVYEWGQVGNSGSRLFSFKALPTQRSITIVGEFLPSSSTSPTSNTPFVDKAEVMENAIEVVIEPKNSDVLVFEDEGQTVFTSNAIYIAHPGGDAVAGSFGRVVDEFFIQYFTNAFLKPLIRDLETADEFVEYFAQGVNGGGRSLGIRAGQKYMTPSGVTIE